MPISIDCKEEKEPRSPVVVFVGVVAVVSRVTGALAAMMILLAALVVCQMVFVRYGLGESSYWQTEFVTYLLIGATFIGSPYVLLTCGHVNVDLVPMLMGERGRRVLALIAGTISFLFCAIVGWTGYELWREAWEVKWLSETVWGPPLWIPYLALPLGFGLLCLQYIAQMVAIALGLEAPFEAEAAHVLREDEKS